ncbi:MAG: hemolysin family protein [Maribacter dokdonensis]|uniref:Hemolysin, contains CBS domains n=8 Tax=Maribacter dokdonensis TaxID=320912 RepID=A0A1H4LFH4_9FLAO|nr:MULTISPECIES: hemolysin family protein [Maribacter]HBU79720.1 HlyC/CorC family transporter [Allomuricauda sp.]APA64432.1 hemolysin [Maribacter sp. 1_2014MBL_MicDiv]PHN94838.1 HlyC/CorC family transporter [Maribacter sp. 6B07]CAG2531578.1 Hemolysin [Maribacter dokdonensis]SDT28452.1 Hemolysin, contains CBS domains [Maribacter dokdonensis]
MGLLIFYAFISIFFSFLCSILEAVLLSITPTFINVKMKEGKSYATTLEALKKDVDQPLIAILTINTIAHTVGAILVGVQAKAAYAELYGSETSSIFGIEFTEDVMVGVVSTIMTILILVASEIIPKTIGATYWKQLANFSTKALNIMVLGLKYTGLLWLLRLFTKMVGGGNHHGSVLSREDFHAMTDMAHEEGVFEKSESTIIKNLLKFDEVLVKDIMTPRAVMKIASDEKTIADFFEDNPKLRFSRIPVYTDKIDNITGFVLKDNVLEEMINKNGDIPLKEIKREILVTRRSTPIPTLFEIFIQKREAIALVVDEYGSVSGLVTMEDVIETLLGLEIMDESDNIADLQSLARKNWETRAKATGVIEKPTSPDE